LWETLLACHVVIAIRNKYAQGISGPELMREYNRLYAERADEWEKLDHYGLPDRRVTVEFYVACKYGPTVLGGVGEVYFLKDALDMQEALANGVGTVYNSARRRAMDIHHNSRKAFFAFVLPTRLEWRVFPSQVYSVHTGDKSRQAKLAENLFFLFDGSIVIKSNTRLSHNVFLPIGQTEPLQELLIEYVQSRKANAKLL
jgi:hypothetical protein